MNYVEVVVLQDLVFDLPLTDQLSRSKNVLNTLNLHVYILCPFLVLQHVIQLKTTENRLFMNLVILEVDLPQLLTKILFKYRPISCLELPNQPSFAFHR